MSLSAASILADLSAVDAERARRSASSGLLARVTALKEFQQRRFSFTYADLLVSARYGDAARFFLDELYGPNDFSRRDAQFARVVPALVRLFPNEIVETVATLAELHSLSEALDTSMGEQLSEGLVPSLAYVAAWQRTGREHDRRRQIELTLNVASRLDRLTRRPLMRHSLRAMRGPARAAGLGELQHFLEAGFDTFRTMKGAREFMELISTREHALVSALFGAPGSAAHIADSEWPASTILTVRRQLSWPVGSGE